MPAIDIFKDDAFSMASLTTSINKLPYQPMRIGELGLFRSEGVMTTSIIIEESQGVLSLVPDGPRGKPVAPVGKDDRTVRSFLTRHLKQDAGILADSFMNLRAFGSETELDAVQAMVDQRMAKLKRNIDVTLEYHRIGAIQGKILDADGTSVIYNLFTEFNVTQQDMDFVLGTATTNIRKKAIAAKRLCENTLGGAAMVTSYRVFCSDSFFDAFTGHAKVEAAFDRWANGEYLRTDSRKGFEFAGITWENYRGSVGGVDFIPDGDAYMVPEGVGDLFQTYYAPADYNETVNTLGLPFYAKQEPMRMDRGVELEAQSNPLCICTRPDAVIRLHSSN